jgi:hypothetical protein
MYSYEITNIMNQQNFNIDPNIYINIIQTSPQIDHVIYKPFGDYYEMWGKDGCYWKFNINKINMKGD